MNHIQAFLERMKIIQNGILDFLESDDDIDEKFKGLRKIFEQQKLNSDKHEFTSFLHLLVKISNNHYSESFFYNKIEQILKYFRNDIQKYLTKYEIFNIFKSNKRILLFLFEEKLIIFDDYIAKKIVSEKFISMKYPQYFSPEIQPFKDQKWFPKKKIVGDNKWIDFINNDLPENFYEKRKTLENDNYIIQLIQKDLISEFIAYINKNNLSLESSFEISIYETNAFLLKNSAYSIIQYATFFGSIQIFNYLLLNDIKLSSYLWPYAIHSKNAEIIHHFEENNVELKNDLKTCFLESIKCHHNDIANYFLDNYIINEEYDDSYNFYVQCLKFYNFSFIKSEFISPFSFYELCKYDHYPIVNLLLEEQDIDFNQKIFYESRKIMILII